MASWGPGVLEQHALVDHGQLEVRIGVVDRDAAGLGNSHHQQRAQGEQARRTERRPATGQPVGGQPPGSVVPAGMREREDRRQQRWFDQRRDGHLAAGAHGAECGPGVQRGQRLGEPGEREQRGDRNHVAGAQRPMQAHERDERRSRERGAEYDPRRSAEYPRARFRPQALLAQQLSQVGVGLQQRRAAASLPARFTALDPPLERRREYNDEQRLHDGGAQIRGSR